MTGLDLGALLKEAPFDLYLARSTVAYHSKEAERCIEKEDMEGYAHASKYIRIGNRLGIDADLRISRENTRENKRLEKKAVTDPLTGAYTRRYLSDGNIKLGSEEGVKLGESKEPADSLFMLDVDYFKKFNDKYGHQVGDSVLIKVVDIVHGIMRGTDTFVRYGGDEFLGILPNTDLEGALVITRKISDEIKNYEGGVLPGGKNVTVSIGVSEITSGRKFETAMCIADRALYGVKKSGRDGRGYINNYNEFFRD